MKMLCASHGTRWLSRSNVVVIYQMCKINISLSVMRRVPTFPFFKWISVKGIIKTLMEISSFFSFLPDVLFTAL